MGTEESSGMCGGNYSQYALQCCDTCAFAEVRLVWDIVFSVVLTGVVCVLGSTANIINIVVFFKQGFHDSVNISLFGLAISDLCSLFVLAWRSVALNPLFQNSDINFDSAQIQDLTAGWPHAGFVRISSCITAFITFERCACIALPLKIKNIITPKRTLICVVCMYLILFTTVFPVFFTIHLTALFQVQRNRSMYVFSFTSQAQTVQNFAFSVNIFIQFSSFIIVVTCTVILIHNLRIKSQWRNKSALNSNLISSRDKRVQKMVIMIASIFIVCLLPSCVAAILTIHWREFSNNGLYQSPFHMAWAVLKMIGGINSSVNILVYFNMSSKFRNNFNELFRTITATFKHAVCTTKSDN